MTLNGHKYPGACVMGSATRIASYITPQGFVAYAISFPGEEHYYQIKECRWISGCVYNEDTDTFAAYFTLYRNVSKNLLKTIENGLIVYSITPEQPAIPVPIPANNSYNFKSFAASNNGKWYVVEISGLGFFRVEHETSVVKRIFAPGIQYGYGSDPAVEMAISDDGSLLLIAGSRMGLRLVSVSETCGDSPGRTMQPNFAVSSMECPLIPLAPSEYIQGFSYAHSPKFSKDNTSISFTSVSVTGNAQHITLFSNQKEYPVQTTYLAIGDSFTSGEGELDASFYRDGAENRCHVSMRSYPYLLTRAWQDVSGHNAACSGASIDSIYDDHKNRQKASQLSEVENRLPQILSVGLGGNDAGLMGKLKSCMGLDTCEWASSAAKRSATAIEIRNLYPKLRQFYLSLGTMIPGKIIAVGYPKIITSDSVCSSNLGIVLNQTERRFMNEGIEYLNKIIQAAANNSGVEYADTQNAFSGSELCTTALPQAMNGIRIGKDYSVTDVLPNFKIIGAESFHPTPSGHIRIKDAILKTFPQSVTAHSCVTCISPIDVPSPNSYWASETGKEKTQRAALFLSKTEIKKGDTLNISLPRLSFRPNTVIAIELHSEVKNIGNIVSSTDGSLGATVATSDLEPGFHSIHLMGTAYSGTQVDIYEFLNIEELSSTPSPTLAVQGLNDPSSGSVSENRLPLGEVKTPTNTQQGDPISSREVLGRATNADSLAENSIIDYAVFYFGVLAGGVLIYILYRIIRSRYHR